MASTCRPARAAAVCMTATAMLAAIVMSGCRQTPASYATANLTNPLSIERAAPVYWKPRSLPNICKAEADRVRGPREEAARSGGVAAQPAAVPMRPRVAIVEFTTEFVTDKLETPFKGQPVVSTTEYGYVGLPVTIIGIGRTRIIYEDILRRHLPDEMYCIFATALEARGFDVLLPQEVLAAPAYEGFVTVKPGSSKPGQIFNIFGSDTGRTKRVEFWPARGLSTVVGVKKGSIKKTLRQIIDETGADAALRVRVRIGVWRGVASVERETHVEVVTLEKAGRIVQQRSIGSENFVIDPTRWRLLQGRVYPVRTDDYVEAMEQIFTPDAQMAADMLRCDQGAQTASKTAGTLP